MGRDGGTTELIYVFEITLGTRKSVKHGMHFRKVDAEKRDRKKK